MRYRWSVYVCVCACDVVSGCRWWEMSINYFLLIRKHARTLACRHHHDIQLNHTRCSIYSYVRLMMRLGRTNTVQCRPPVRTRTQWISRLITLRYNHIVFGRTMSVRESECLFFFILVFVFLLSMRWECAKCTKGMCSCVSYIYCVRFIL